MNDLLTLISMAETGLRFRGRWCPNPAFRKDAREMVEGLAKPLGLSLMGGYSQQLYDAVIRELERDVAADCDPPSHITDPKDDGSCAPLYGQRMDSADCGES